jgi:OFA family oxalate/formate antiporter-like MFS transporter
VIASGTKYFGWIIKEIVMANQKAQKEMAQAGSTPPGRLKYPIVGILMMLCIGNVYSWSVFSKPLQAEGWTAAQTTLPFQLSIVVFTIAMVFAGRWQDRSGPKPVAVFSGIMMGAGFILIRFFGQTLTGMLISFSGIASIGMGAGYVTPLSTALKWYPDKRGLISGIVVLGMGAGSIFGGIGGPLLIEKFGIWNTFLIFGILFGAVITACGLVLKNPPPGYFPPASIGAVETKKKETAIKPYDYSAKEMLGTASFYLMWLVFLIGTSGGLMVISQASPFGQNVLGLKPVMAGSVITVLAVFNGLGRPVFGFLSDKIGRKNAIFVAFVIQLIALTAVLPYASSYVTYAIGVSLMGFAFGGFLGMMPSITADYFGLKNIGLNYACVYTGWGAAGFLGPQIVNVLVGGSVARGDWNNAFYFAAAACVIGMVLWYFTKPPVRPQAPTVSTR